MYWHWNQVMIHIQTYYEIFFWNNVRRFFCVQLVAVKIKQKATLNPKHIKKIDKYCYVAGNYIIMFYLQKHKIK